jgi:trehalose/maltose hydrolase-like predicted phosphorylase
MSKSVLRGIGVILAAIAIVIALLLIPAKPPKRVYPPNNDPSVLVNYNPKEKYGTFLGNGFISTRIMGDGVGSQDGKPLPCYMAGLYDDEKLVPIPTWSDLRFYDGKTQFVIDKTADYKQTLDMRTGVFSTYATWRAGDKTLKGRIRVIVSRSHPNIGLVEAELTPNFSGTVRISAPLADAHTGLQKLSGSLIRLTSGKPLTTSVYRTRQSKIAVAIAFSVPGTARVRENTEFRVRKWASVSQSANVNGAVGEAITALRGALQDETRTLNEHKAAWQRLWRSDIVIHGPRKDQQVIHSCMFYLLSSVREGSIWSIPPMGLSNNAFSGHVFWDADTWMFPALILQYPDLARSIVEYRYHTLPGAFGNARAAGMPGAQYAWESGYTGKEDTPEGLPYRHERHINGDVALAQWQYYLATGDLDWLRSRGFPVIKATADWWVAKAKWVPSRKRYEIHQVVPPDENAELVNNSVYTNSIAKLNLEIADRVARLLNQKSNPRWLDVANKMYIPFDPVKQRFVAFDGYGAGAFGPRYKAKQADTELVIYPLQLRISQANMTDIYKRTFDFYAPRVHEGGPAMTSSIHCIIAARLGDCKRAYAEFIKSYKPFIRGPFNMFNEKPSRYLDNMCFLTGAAGTIQGVLYGIAGIKMDYLGNPELTFKPCLPKQWKKLTIKNIRWRGKTFDLTILPGNQARIIQTD